MTARRWDGCTADVEVQVIPLCSRNSHLPRLLLCIRDQTAEREAQKWPDLIGAVVEKALLPDDPHGITEVLKLLTDTGYYRRAELWRRDSKTEKWASWATPDGRRETPSEMLRRRLDAAASGRTLDPVIAPHDVASAGGRARHLAGSLVAVPLATGVVLLLEQDDLQVGRVDRQSLRTLTALLAAAVRRQLQAEDLDAMQQRVARAERLEALGLLTTSVAHDLNNVLSIIFGYCDLAGQSTGSSDCVEQILLAAEKGARIVRQLLSSSRTNRHDLATFDVSEALTELKPLLTSLTGSTISLVIDRPAHETFPVRMPRTDFDQVLLNLLANARDAMPDGGTLRCILDRYDPELRDLKPNPALHSAPCVRLRVIDAGCGMTDDTRRRIFEPFFTTKTGDRGTGVGLSTVRQIIDRAAGGITVASVPGTGTDVSVLLPRVLSALSPRMVDIPAQVDPRGSESVLIVCEDARMRELLARLLQVRGYRVTSRESLADVEPHGRQASGSFDLLLAEAAMIDRSAGSGTTLKGKLPPRLLRIGDIDAPARQTVSGFGFVQTLVKPFTSQQLAIAVREALGDSTRPPAAEVTA